MARKEEANGNGEYKLSVERRLTGVETNVTTIMTNHLPHIDQKLDILDGKVDEISIQIARWAGAIGLITILAQLVLKYMK